MGKFYFAFAWDIIVNLNVCICKNKICIWSDPGVNLPICKYTPVCICVRMPHLLTPSKICTPEYIYTCVFLAHANWTLYGEIMVRINSKSIVENSQTDVNRKNINSVPIILINHIQLGLYDVIKPHEYPRWPPP